jgi:predicted AlkP superfamily phosphohydrolase/phosphomutase
MSRSERRRFLAIGVDAAEPTLVRQLLDRGDLPVLRELAAEGVWGRVISPAPIGSGAVWPSFVTGRTPAEHTLYGEWAWRPDTMGLVRPTWDHLDPFWRSDATQGRIVVIFDVPFAPLLDLPGCTEILDWGAHELLKGRLEVSPRSLEPVVAEVGGIHPFAAGQIDATGPQDHVGLAHAVAGCVAGVKQRGRLARRLLSDTTPDLMVMVFTELHRAEHLLWHTVDPLHPDYRPAAAGDQARPGLPELLQAIDREIGHLRDLAGPEAAILIFSLHGMRPTRGIPTILGPLLEAHGFAVPRAWSRRSWPERVDGALTAVKRTVPDRAKRLYHRWLPQPVISRLTQPSMPLPAYDWSRTTAISLPTDQHGWIRVNLRGREARGSVEPEQYDALCQRVEEALRAATRIDGKPIVRAVSRTTADAGMAVSTPLPDLVVHWDDTTFDSPLRLAEPRLVAFAVGRKFMGQHAFEGFYLLRPAPGRAAPAGGPVAAEHLHRLLRDAPGRCG